MSTSAIVRFEDIYSHDRRPLGAPPNFEPYAFKVFHDGNDFGERLHMYLTEIAFDMWPGEVAAKLIAKCVADEDTIIVCSPDENADVHYVVQTYGSNGAGADYFVYREEGNFSRWVDFGDKYEEVTQWNG